MTNMRRNHIQKNWFYSSIRYHPCIKWTDEIVLYDNRRALVFLFYPEVWIETFKFYRENRLISLCEYQAILISLNYLMLALKCCINRCLKSPSVLRNTRLYNCCMSDINPLGRTTSLSDWSFKIQYLKF